jgi:glycosyltransferase involved in cell wall biosynthesis
MPVYNGAASMGAAIKSILSQTLSDFELIIVNDGSTDGSYEVARSFTDLRIRLINLPLNQGLIRALNTGISEARGEFLARMDHDDIAHPTRLEQQVSGLTRQDSVICGTAIQPFGAIEGRPISFPLSDIGIRAALPVVSPFAHPSVTMRTEVCRRLGYSLNAKHCEDYDLWWRISAEGKMMNLPQTLLDYRHHEGQISVKHRIAQLAGMASIATEGLRREGRFRSKADLRCHSLALSYQRVSSRAELEAIGDWLQWLRGTFGVAGMEVAHHYHRVWRGICSRQPHLGTSSWSTYKKFLSDTSDFKADILVILSAYGRIDADDARIEKTRRFFRR